MTAVPSVRSWVRLGRAVVALAALAVSAGAMAEDLEAKVKSAYLFHLVKFVEWPELPPTELRLCVLGDGAVGSQLSELAGRPAKNRSLVVAVDPEAGPAGCQLLFIGRARSGAEGLLERLRGSPVLTVGDRDGFVASGGIVGFYSEGGRIKLEIDPEAARTAGLRISGKLMELARPVAPH